MTSRRSFLRGAGASCGVSMWPPCAGKTIA
ncbi:twin-arginine translocation signal domain-containing protein [Oceanidesulfovibrio marinus]|uniref:Twin-arginine translocation signal domain-containing protein n=1 Tax=Oceanidesulfovibrio marinus TaxID=370038 RepID=A0A6P1ZKJ7_9BACT|nr:hypothetical protein DQK91_02895 [Oceanidesulfovibrio marinus]